MPKQTAIQALQNAFATNKKARQSESDAKRPTTEALAAESEGINNDLLHPIKERYSRGSTSASLSLDIPGRTGGDVGGSSEVPNDGQEARKNDTQLRSPNSTRRFSLMRFKHASDSALHTRVKQDEQPPLPLPVLQLQTADEAPKIIKTSPTFEMNTSPTPTTTKKSWLARAHGSKLGRESRGTSSIKPSTSPAPTSSRRQLDAIAGNPAMRGSRVTFDEQTRPSLSADGHHPPPYDENHGLNVPHPRLSESSRSTAGSGDDIAYATTTTTTTTTTTFWRIPRRKRNPNRNSMFPLPAKGEGLIVTDGHGNTTSTTELRPSDTLLVRPNSQMSNKELSDLAAKRRPTSEFAQHKMGSALAASAISFMGPGAPGAAMLRSESKGSAASIHSDTSTPGTGTPRSISRRGRSATMTSLEHPDGRASGRSSLGGFFGLRIRRDSEPQNGSRTASPQPVHGGSMAFAAASTDKLIVPDRKEDDTPETYLARLENTISRGVVASLLSRSGDEFHQKVLKAYLATFDFQKDPMDMALRKLLMEVELPRETQQIDRVLEAFAERYHECNPQIFVNAGSAYFIAFSLLILHTDVFNKANRHKMQKADYLKNTQGEGIGNEILECFYDNITYTPFIHVEDDIEFGEKLMQRPKKSLFGRSQTDLHRMKEPIDPYTLILENRLDWLRPTLKEVMQLDDPFNYLGTAHKFDMAELHRSFFKTGVLQIVSERSRPNAFQSPSTVENPQDANPGVVDIKITKVGTLWRKDLKKKRTRSPWQEWGVILTGSQLYFFKNLSWIKDLLHQQKKHREEGNVNNPVVFSPPLLVFKPDALLSTDNAVALHDGQYKKHKHAFAFVRHSGMLEYFLADDEEDMNDWIAKLNYAATFRTAGIRMRGAYDVNRSRGVRRLDSTSTTPRPKLTGDSNGRKLSVDPQLAMEISVARRQLMVAKIAEADKKLENTNKQMELLLRNARHLQILAPIQAKAREQVIHSASALSAKLKWVRMEYWKLQCHRDILALDLEDEKTMCGEESLRTLTAPKAPGSPRSSIVRPSTAGSATPTPSQYGTPLEALQPIQSNSSTKKQLEKWEMPKLQITASQEDVTSPTALSPQSPSLAPTPSPQPEEIVNVAPLDSISARPSEDLARPATPVKSHSPADSQTSFEEAMFSADSVNELERRPSEKEKDKDRNPIPKIRTSLKNTLRDVPIRGHRSRKSKDFNGSTPENDKKKEESADEGLQRASKNFTVHGKKASIITFGSEWNSMTPEERLRRHRSAASNMNGESDVSDSSGLMRRPSAATAVSGKSSSTVIPPPVDEASEDSNNTATKTSALAVDDAMSKLDLVSTAEKKSEELKVMTPIATAE